MKTILLLSFLILPLLGCASGVKAPNLTGNPFSPSANIIETGAIRYLIESQ